MVQVASGLFLLRGNWSGRSSLIGEVRRKLPHRTDPSGGHKRALANDRFICNNPRILQFARLLAESRR